MDSQRLVLTRSLLMPNKKIYESPDGGKTVYERDFGSSPKDRKQISSEDDDKTYPFREDVPADLWGKPIVNKTIGEKVFGYHPQELLTNKILPIDVFYKLFGQKQ